MVVMVAVLFFYVKVSQVWPQEKRESQENKFIILTSPRNKKDRTKPRATWKSTHAGREAAAVAGEESLGHSR